jgi:acyl-CoA-dependent ceramide synthase
MESPIIVPYFIFFLFSWAYLRHYINLKILFSFLPLPMPFPDHINAKILSTLSTASAPISAAFATIGPLFAPLTKPLLNFLTTLFPETVSLLRTLPSRTIEFFNTPSDFASVGPYTLNWETQQYKCWISQYITFFLLLALQLVNLFWFFLILRILWRLVASGFKEKDDVRSEDDDEEDVVDRQVTLDELRAEQRGDEWGGETGADIRQGKKPQVLVNGVPLEKENGKAT